MHEGMDNMIWSGSDAKIVEWCERNKVFDETMEAEIEESGREKLQTKANPSD